jgi:hypothetical protein
MSVIHYPKGEHWIDKPIILREGDLLTGDGLQTKLFARDGFDMIIIDATENLKPESTAMIKDITIVRAPNSVYKPDVNIYNAAIRVKSSGGFFIENVYCVGHGISYRFDIDAHNGFIDKCWGTYTRCGIYLEDSGGVNITDLWLNNLYLLGEFTPNDDLIEQYNYGIYQKSKTVGDINIMGCTILRFNEGVYLEGFGGNNYNYNLRFVNNTIDQCNGGITLKNFNYSTLMSNHVMCYAKHTKYIKRIINCNITPENYTKFNIFRGKSI